MLTQFFPLKCQSSYTKKKYTHIVYILMSPCKALMWQSFVLAWSCHMLLVPCVVSHLHTLSGAADAVGWSS